MPKSPKQTHQIIRSFEAKAQRKRSFSTKIADWLTSAFGTVSFLILNFIFFALWIMANTGVIPGIPTFDPYPYVLLITFVSLEAIFLTVIVLISQKRQNQIDTIREELSLQVEIIAEREISKVLKLLGMLMKKEGIEVKDPELAAMLDAVDTSYIEKKLEEQISPKPKSIKETVKKPIAKAGETINKPKN